MWLYCYIYQNFSSFYTCAICVEVQSVLLKILYVCIRKSVLLKSYTFGCHAYLNIYVVLQLGRHVYFTTELKLEPTYRGGRKTTFQAGPKASFGTDRRDFQLIFLVWPKTLAPRWPIWYAGFSRPNPSEPLLSLQLSTLKGGGTRGFGGDNAAATRLLLNTPPTNASTPAYLLCHTGLLPGGRPSPRLPSFPLVV